MIEGFNPILQTLFATLFTWFVTALGAATVFAFKNIDRKLLDGMLGFAAGVMISASYWSLLAPSIELTKEINSTSFIWLPPTIGFLIGSISLFLIDRILPHLHLYAEADKPEGIKTNLQKTILLTLAVTLHNIPEGLAIGVAFGAIEYGIPSASLSGAIALAIGIGIQNFPEGMAISMPLRGEGISKLKSFWYGQLSAIVEPIAGIIGASIVLISRSILPYALSFAAGAMIFVVVEELIPESQMHGNTDFATISAIIGFVVMMALDVAFG
ncbi:MAG: ZIP family metal transporter [Nitrososphaerota archaeon]